MQTKVSLALEEILESEEICAIYCYFFNLVLSILYGMAQWLLAMCSLTHSRTQMSFMFIRSLFSRAAVANLSARSEHIKCTQHTHTCLFGKKINYKCNWVFHWITFTRTLRRSRRCACIRFVWCVTCVGEPIAKCLFASIVSNDKMCTICSHRFVQFEHISACSEQCAPIESKRKKMGVRMNKRVA